MTSAQHTPGPLEELKEKDRLIAVLREQISTLVMHLEYTRQRADDNVRREMDAAGLAVKETVRLTGVNAALLEALERIEESLHRLANGGGAEGKPTMGECKQGMRLARDAARAAIRAAKGESK